MKPSSYTQSVDIDLAIKEHLPLVKRIAHQICSRLPPNVEVDDLIQEGLTGLLDALTRYEPQANLNFEICLEETVSFFVIINIYLIKYSILYKGITSVNC